MCAGLVAWLRALRSECQVIRGNSKSKQQQDKEEREKHKANVRAHEEQLRAGRENARALGPMLRFLFEHCLPDCTCEWRVPPGDHAICADATATAFLKESIPVQQWGAVCAQTTQTWLL